MSTLTQEKNADRSTRRECLTDSFEAAKELGAGAINENSDSLRIQNILVPLSSLDSAQRVLESARWFANQTGGKVTVLYSIAHDGSFVSPEELREEITHSSGIKSAQLHAILILQGAPSYVQIRNIARNEASDLIIISADFYRGPRHFWQADPMEGLIRFPPCPLLIVSNHEVRPGSNLNKQKRFNA